MGMFATDTFNVGQTVGGGGQTMTLNIANSESNLSMNLGANLQCNVYVWRPSTGTKVGTVCANLAMTGDAEPGAANSIRVNNCTTASTTQVTAAAGDILVCEIWQVHTQAAATAYSGSFYMEGSVETATTNTVVTNHASFLNFSTSTLTFGTPSSSISGSFSQTLGTVALSTNGDVVVTASKNATLSTVALTTNGDVVSSGLFSNGLADASLSATGSLSSTVYTGTLSATLDDVTRTGAGTVASAGTVNGSFVNTLANATVTASASVVSRGSFTGTLASVGVTATGKTGTRGSFGATLSTPSLTGVGLVTAQAVISGALTTVLDSVSVDANGTVPAPENVSQPLEGGFGTVGDLLNESKKRFGETQTQPGKGLDDIFGIDSPRRKVEDVNPPSRLSVLASAISSGNGAPVLPGTFISVSEDAEEDDIDLMLFLALIA